jgi:lambda family phage tail tape measure protein
VSFTIVVNMGGNAVPGTAAIATGLNNATAAAARTQAAVNQTGAATATMGATAQAAGAKAAAGHGAAAKAADSHGDSITRLIHLAEAYFAVHQFEAIIDGYIEVRNKINAVSESHDNLNGLMEETFRIAQETRSSWDGVGATYQRLANAGRSLGVSQRQLLDLTEELSMGMRLSGSSSREAQMTMMELTHAFTVGTLTGREFRVMMKDAPALMHELQVVSGKTGAEFAEMGKHGKFTAQTIMEWFTKAGPAIKEKFADTLPTIGEGFQLIRNAAEKFFGSAAVGTGLMGTLSGAMKFVADHFDTIGKTALAVGEALLGLFVIEKIIVMVKALTVAIAANPLGLLLTAVAVGISLLRQFGDQINTNVKVWRNVDGVFVTVADSLGALWTQLKALGAEILTFVKEAWGALAKAFGDGLDTAGIDFSLHGAIRMVSGFVGAVRELFHIMADDSGRIWAMISVGIVKAMEAAANGALRAMDAIAAGPRKALFDVMSGTFQKQRDAMNAATKEYIEYTSRHDAEIVNQAKLTTGYGKYNVTGDPNFHSTTKAELDAEIARRKKIILDAQLESQYAQRGLDAQGNDPRNGASGRFFRDITIPIDPAVAALAKSGLDDMRAAADAAMKDFDKIEHDIAATRIQGAKEPGYVSDVRGKPDKKIEDDKGLEKLKNELRAITEAVNPQVAAIEKLSHAHEILGKAVGHHLISQEESVRLYDLYALKLEEQIHPFDAWIKKQTEATAALRDNSEEQERAQKLQAALDDLKQKQGGVTATPVEVDLIAKRIAADQQLIEKMQAERSIMDGLLAPQHAYQLGLKAADALQKDNKLSAEQYGRAVDEIRAAYLTAKPGAKSFADGIEAAWLQMKRDADDFGASVAKLASDDLNKLNDAIIAAANGGKVAWAEMVDAMIQDLERLILKQLEVAAINAIITAATGGVPVPGAGEAIVGTSSPSLSTAIGASTRTSTPAPQPAPATQVVNKIVNVIDRSTMLAALDSPEGGKVMLNHMRANQGAVRSYSGTRR